MLPIYNTISIYRYACMCVSLSLYIYIHTRLCIIIIITIILMIFQDLVRGLGRAVELLLRPPTLVPLCFCLGIYHNIYI